ncbi:MMPL family transporter [Propioniciclava sp.]|uniref:MMPL family transporter n=1 Tax=Propioniciclava sp. TaxID=2038686 RepID=UPI002624ADC8|nr:MMPL family transporter [Propioniciclava sp.]
MSTFIYRLAQASWRAPKRVIAAWFAVLVLLGGLVGVLGAQFDNEFRIPGASSQAALDQLRMTFPEAAMSSATMVVIAPAGQTMTDPAVRAELERAASELERIDWVNTVQLPYSEYLNGLISDDGAAALLTVRADQGITVSTFTDDQRRQLLDAGTALQNAIPGSTVHVGGDLFSMSMPHLTWVEAVGVVVAIVVLFFTLGSLYAAAMPLVSALMGAGISSLLIMAASHVFAINSTTLMLALMLALAVGIDYSLFIVSRHRDQLATGMEAAASAARATATAGSAVLFAGITVIIALVGLGIAGMPFLTIMGVFAALAVAIEVALAVTLLPAMMSLAGERLRPKRPRVRARSDSTGEAVPAARPRFNASKWWVGVVTRVPLLTVAVVVVALGALTLPAQHLHLALPNSGRNDPAAADRVTFDVISERFGVGYNGPLVITGTIVESTDPMGVIDGIKADVEADAGVQLVAAAVPNPNVDTLMIQVIPTTGPDDPATTGLVQRLRALEPHWQEQYGVTTAVTGFTAIAIDVSDQLGRALFPFGVFVMGLSLVLLTVVFRSIWVPVKAALGYLLSVGAAFGITALVFNDGIGRQFINLAEAQPIISFLPIILMGILFGLAMDYEVFLTTRMREEHVHGNHTDPVEQGFIHSAKVVVAAALIMVSVFAFFIPEGDVTLKPIAFGLALGVAIDAFLIRMTLGPAVMKLLGERAWRLPHALDRRLPVLDAEGEAITHQLSLAQWPSPDSRAVIHGEGLGAATDDVTLFEGVDVDVQPGRTLVLTGEPAGRRALLLALAGRLTLTAGDLKVLGLVLPQEAGRLRRRSTFVDGASAGAARALGGSVGDLVLVDDADRLDLAARDALRELAARTEPPTLVLGATDADGVRALLPQRARQDAVTVGEPS